MKAILFLLVFVSTLFASGGGGGMLKPKLPKKSNVEFDAVYCRPMNTHYFIGKDSIRQPQDHRTFTISPEKSYFYMAYSQLEISYQEYTVIKTNPWKHTKDNMYAIKVSNTALFIYNPSDRSYEYYDKIVDRQLGPVMVLTRGKCYE